MTIRFAEPISRLPPRNENDPPSPGLLLWSDPAKQLECYYAPFEHLNDCARIVLVGITPGRTQMNLAVEAARAALLVGDSVEEALRETKRKASFGGGMRRPLVQMLDLFGYARRLGIPTSDHLWGSANDQVHFCSLLKYPVFVGGRGYNGKPDMLRHPRLNALLREEFVIDVARLPVDAILVPLGETVLKVILKLQEEGLVPQQLLWWEGRAVALPHPAGGNGESIALALQIPFPPLQEYVESQWRKYLQNESWISKGRSGPQDETNYKMRRQNYWERLSATRLAHGLPE